MSKDEMSHDHITGDFQISQNLIGSCYTISILICILFVAESMVIFLVEAKVLLDCYCRVIIAFLILKLSKLKLFQFSRITKKQWLIIIIGFILANGADYIYFEFMPTTGMKRS